MTSSWIIETNGDPLGTVRILLMAIWHSVGLDGMLVPVYLAEGTSVTPGLVFHLDHLAQSDPFAPRISINSAKLALQYSQEYPGAHLGAVLRSCEARAFRQMVDQNRLSVRQWLIISVDCLASFPEMDFEWRVRKAHRVEVLTREALRFARQGGIAPYRFRNACQMCWDPSAQEADLKIEVIGVPVRQFVILSVRDEDLERELRLDEFANGIAPESVLSRRKKALAAIAGRRSRALELKVQTLSEDAPADLRGLMQYIAGCAPCQECLEACPNYTGDFIPARNGGIEALQVAKDWLQACVACGMCEDACPRNLSLTAILSQIAHPELAVRVAVPF